MHRSDGRTHPPVQGVGDDDTRAITVLWTEMARGWAAGDAALFAANFAISQIAATFMGGPLG